MPTLSKRVITGKIRLLRPVFPARNRYTIFMVVCDDLRLYGFLWFIESETHIIVVVHKTWGRAKSLSTSVVRTTNDRFAFAFKAATANHRDQFSYCSLSDCSLCVCFLLLRSERRESSKSLPTKENDIDNGSRSRKTRMAQ